MRGSWLLLVALLVLGGAAYAWLTADPGPTMPANAQPDEREETPDPLRTDGVRTRSPGPAAKGARAATPPTVALVAVDAETGVALTGFRIEVLKGDRVVAAGTGMDRYVARLAPGRYRARAQHADYLPGEPHEFTVAARGAQTVRVPLRVIEASLAVEVLDVGDSQRLAAYRAIIRVYAPGAPRPEVDFRPAPKSNPLIVHAKRDHKLVVQIEAEGYEPADPLTVEFREQPKVTRRVFLARAAKFTGVELRVADAAQSPVPHLSVKAMVRPHAAAEYRVAWERRASSANGRYKLPGLKSGGYRLEVVAADEAGNTALFLPHRLEFEFTGNEHILESITLRPGANVRVEVSDGRGRVIGKDLLVRLTDADGKRRRAIWQPIENGKLVTGATMGADHFVRDGPARLYRCVPAGRYTLEVQRGTEPPHRRSVELTAGEVARVSVQLR